MIMDFRDISDLSIVTMIIPQSRLPNCLSKVLSAWQYNAIQFDCRGTVIGEHWLQALLPIMNPECEYLQFVVKDADVDAFMNFCVEVNDLHLPGAGAIFTTKCTRAFSNSKYILSYKDNTDTDSFTSQDEAQQQFKHELHAIYGLIQSGRTEQAIKAAIQAGSHGPIVYFVEGRGTRDRAGWLKITKKPYEEVVMVLVEDIDRANVVDALVTAGKIGSLGSGVVFDMPVEQGLINLPTSISNKSHRSSNEQITAAIDKLMGNTDWRNSDTLKSLINNTQLQQSENSEEVERVLLNALLPRKHANDFLDQILIIGIPGANVIYTKLFALDDAENEKGVQLHHERVQIRMVVLKEQAEHYMAELKKFAIEQDYNGVTLYEQELGQAVSYRIKTKEKTESVRLYRGARVES